jgi:hypothetical protein
MEVMSECEVRFVISFAVYSGLGDIGCHIRLLQNPLIFIRARNILNESHREKYYVCSVHFHKSLGFSR